MYYDQELPQIIQLFLMPTQNLATSDSSPKAKCLSLAADGLRIFYREAGPDDAPVILLLHGFPSSSFYYRNLIPRLAGKYHVIAPDYPGFGFSDTPAVDQFNYSFDRLAEVIGKFVVAKAISHCVIYMQDYGGPVGMRLAVQHPEWISGLVFQNANVYHAGLMERFLLKQPLWRKRNGATEAPVLRQMEHDSIKSLYTHGARRPEDLCPDGWTMDSALIQRPGNMAIQLELQAGYESNLLKYPEWQEWLRRHQPPTLVAWGKNDPIFGPKGAEAFRQDLPNAEIHLLDTGHFALEEDTDVVAGLVSDFMERNLTQNKT